MPSRLPPSNLFESSEKKKMNFENAAAEQRIDIPFRVYIPAGSSHFEIRIPASQRHRAFYFSYVSYYPDFYSNQAALLDLDTDAEMDETFFHFVQLKCQFGKDDTLFPGALSLRPTVVTTMSLATTFNKFFEFYKPEGVVSLGAFFDWADKRKPMGTSLEKWVEVEMAQDYYGEPFNRTKHFNALPLSAQLVSGSNNYLFPTNLTADNLPFLVYRLNLAPNTDASFANSLALQDFGFTDATIGKRQGPGAGQYRIENEDVETYRAVVSGNPISVRLTPDANKLRIALRVHNKMFLSEQVQVKITRRDSYADAKYEAKLKAAFLKMEEMANLRVGFSFDGTKKTFKFHFPENANLRNLTVLTDRELSQRLGFDFRAQMSVDNPEGKKIPDSSDVRDAREKSIAIAYDTGLVVVSDENQASCSTVGISDRVMCTLNATHDGQLKIHLGDKCDKPVTTKAARFLDNVDGFVSVRFKLSRIVDSNDLVALVWKPGSYIQGNLRSC